MHAKHVLIEYKHNLLKLFAINHRHSCGMFGTFLKQLKKSNFTSFSYFFSFRAWMFGEGVCQFSTFIIDIGVISGFMSMTSIALDRYLLISREYPRYIALQTRRNVLRTIAIVWTISVTIAVVEIIVWNSMDWETVNGESYDFRHECLSPPRNNPVFALTVFVISFLIPIISIVGMSLRFMVLLRRRLQKYKSSSAEGPTRPSGHATSSQSNSQQNPDNVDQLQRVRPNVNPTKFYLSSPGIKTPEMKYKKELGVLQEANAFESDQLNSINLQDVNITTNNYQKVSNKPPAGRINVEKVSGSDSNSSNVTSGRAERMRNRYIRPAIVMITLVTCFLICTLPYMVYISVVIRICPMCDNAEIRFHLSNVLFLNSCVNPFVYAATHPKIRKFHRKIIRSLIKLVCWSG